MTNSRIFLYAAGASLGVLALYHVFFRRTQARAASLDQGPVQFTVDLPTFDWQLIYDRSMPECRKGNKKECRKAERALANGAVAQEGVSPASFVDDGTGGFFS